MSDFVNDRDLFLAANGPINIDPRRGKDLFLTADPTTFQVDANGAGSPALATITAHLIGIPGAVLWSTTNGAVLSGSDANVRTLAFIDMPGDRATVAATIVYDGQAYFHSLSISKFAGVTTEAVLGVLDGQLTETQLVASLRDRINLIDDPATTAGSVQARVKAETDARVAAIQTEIDDRIAAVLAEAGARTTYVQSYTYSKAETESALSIQATALAAYADARKGEAIAAAAADVRNYSYSKADVNSAEAAQSAALTTGYTNYADTKKAEAISVASADVRSYGYSKSATDGAIASTADTLRAEFASSNGASTAYVQNYAYSKAQIDSAESAQSSSLTAGYQGYADARKAEAISVAAADVRTFTYSKAAIDGAFSSQSSQISAAFTYADTKKAEAISASSADIRDYAYSKADTTGAIASQTSSLSTTVGEHTATIQSQATSINGLGAQLTFKIDNNNHVTGFGLASTLVDGVPQSAFAILADRFLVVGPNGPEPMFTAGGGTVGFSGLLKGPSGSFGTVTVDGSVSSGQTAYDTGNGFWLQGGATPKFSMKTASGAKLLCDPGNNILKLVDPTIERTTPFAVNNIADGAYGFTHNTGEQFLGNYTANSTGGTGASIFDYSLDMAGAANQGMTARISKVSNTLISVYGTCKFVANCDIYIVVRAVDASGSSAVPEFFNINVDWS